MRPILYQFWRSSASWRVRWALAIKGVAFDVESLDLATGQQDAGPHLARSPLGTVPVLCIDGRHLSESVAIIEYLEETIPEPALLPRDPWLRARTRQLVELVNAGVQPLQIARVRELHARDEAERNAWVRHFSSRGLAACERLLATIARETATDGPFAVGDSVTAADLFLTPQLQHSRRFAVDLSAFPRLLRAEHAALQTAHAAATRPELQPGAPPTHA